MLKVKNLSFKMQTSEARRNIFLNVSFEIPDGASYVMLGHSGSGKTSIANAILGVLPNKFIQGEINFSDGFQQKQDIGYIPQDAHSALNPLYKTRYLLESLAELKSISTSDFQSRCDYLLPLLGLKNTDLDKYSYQLSGGMKQKVLIALAALGSPKLIIADEPTASVDAIYKKEILDLLMQIKNKFKSSIFLITHDISIAGNYADFIGVLSIGQLVESGTREQMIKYASHPATLELKQARISKNDVEALLGK